MLSKEEQFHYKLLGLDARKLYFVINSSPSLTLVYGSLGLKADHHPLSLFKCNVQIQNPTRSIQTIIYDQVSYRANYLDLQDKPLTQVQKILNDTLTNLIYDPKRLLNIIEETNFACSNFSRKNGAYSIINHQFELNDLINTLLKPLR